MPPQAAEWLARDWRAGTGPLDLSGTLVVVPTRQSGRRLRELLAEHAHAGGSAVLAPRVILPEDLLAPAPDAAVASPLFAQLAWAETLHRADLAEFRAVFPLDPPARDFAWATRLAAQFQRLQATLGENGLCLQDVVRRAGDALPESERWLQLAELERRCGARVAAAGQVIDQVARLAAARAPILPEGIRRVVLIGTPDPLPLALDVLQAFARQVTVDVVMYGPAGGEDLFDEWGRPLEEAWTKRAISLPDFNHQVRICADAADQAAQVATLASSYPQPEGLLAVGVADGEVAPLLEHHLRDAGVVPFNPSGRARRHDALHALLATLAALVREPAFETMQSLARCPDFIGYVESRSGPGFSAAAMLSELDDLHARHLPATIGAALAHTAKRPSARTALEAALDLRSQLTQGTFPANASAALGALFNSRRVASESALVESAEAWMEILREAGGARTEFPGLSDAEWWDLTLARFAASVHFVARPAGALDLLGWLELLWEDSPHLVVTGLNDGRVPETVAGDAFLPEALRRRLGLKTNEARFARDAYLLAALAAARSANGRLDVLVGKVSAAGDPLRPSRLLLRCADEELPRRVAALFQPAPAGPPGHSWRRAWRLVPPVLPPPARVSVTAFRDYLRCPFRFYLKHVLRMEALDPFKSELDALDFGTLCHAALEAMGLEPAMRDSTDAAALREFLRAHVDHRARARYGAELTLPLIVQLESARQRLARAADVQAAERAAGWAIMQVERKFELPLGAITVSGKIDRIERGADGAVRVIDYKTSDKGITPYAAHVRNARRTETAPPWARFSIGGRDLVWTDLQLPLYLEALSAEFGPAVTAGYFNLPKAVGETGLHVWTEYDGQWRAAARRCAEGAAAAIAAGTFWPPAEIPARDEDDAFAGLFHHGTAESVDWRGEA